MSDQLAKAVRDLHNKTQFVITTASADKGVEWVGSIVVEDFLDGVKTSTIRGVSKDLSRALRDAARAMTRRRGRRR